MDKGVLLVLLCLQAFLLFTAFTSTDAAALVSDDVAEEVTAHHRKLNRQRDKQGYNCRRRPGRCGGIHLTSQSELRPRPQNSPKPRPGHLSVIMLP